MIVAVDGGGDATAERARAAGADIVLELPRGGKHAAQNAAVAQARGELLAFSDANARWQPDSLRRLLGPFAHDPSVGYVCGQASFVGEGGGNQEGVYWRYELFLRERESAGIGSITAGNGAIYALRRADYDAIDTSRGHDLALPHQLVRRGRRAVYAPLARATEKMVPSVEGEWRRKRRMMRQAWPIVTGSGLLDPRGVPPRYAAALFSHRALRYGSPLLHTAALAASRRRPLALGAQLALLGAAAAGGRWRRRPLLLARYYVLTTASIAAGWLDWRRHGEVSTWDAAEGTR